MKLFLEGGGLNTFNLNCLAPSYPLLLRKVSAAESICSLPSISSASSNTNSFT